MLVWDQPLRVPQLEALVARYKLQDKWCRAAARACDAQRIREARGARTAGPDACLWSRALCMPLSEGGAPPGFSADSDPLQNLARRPEVATALGLLTDDVLEYAGLTEMPGVGYTVRYRQKLDVGDARLIVAGGDLLFQLTADGAHATEIDDRLKIRTGSVVPATISAGTADYAVSQFLARNGVEDAVLFAPGNRFDTTPVVLVEDGIPRVVYNVVIRSARVPDLSQTVFFVDGTSGQVIGQEQPPGEHQVRDYKYTLVPEYQIAGFAFVFNPAVLSIWPAVCVRTSGEGLDRFGVTQKFSTTVLPDPAYLLNGGFVSYYEHYTSSCQEQTPGGLQAAQVMTFFGIPVPAKWPANPLYAYVDPNTKQPTSALYATPVPSAVFTDPVFDSVLGVEGQHTGEVLVKYVRPLGYEYRQTKRALDGAPIPVRVHSNMGATPQSDDPPAGNAWSTSSVDMQGTFEEANGYLSFTYGDGVTTKTAGWSDPTTMAHEFFHTAIWDAVFARTGSDLAQSMKETSALEEGLADCFAMVYGYDHQEDLGKDVVAPFYHLGNGIFMKASDANRGLPNLDDPHDSALHAFDDWWGASELNTIISMNGNTEDPHLASSIVSAACRSLVTGWYGKAPCSAPSQRSDGSCIVGDQGLPAPRDRSTGDALDVYRTNALADYALGCTNPHCPDEPLGMARLKDLLIGLVIKQQLTNTMTIGGEKGLVAAMASVADSLGKSKWGPITGSYGERCPRCFRHARRGSRQRKGAEQRGEPGLPHPDWLGAARRDHHEPGGRRLAPPHAHLRPIVLRPRRRLLRAHRADEQGRSAERGSPESKRPHDDQQSVPLARLFQPSMRLRRLEPSKPELQPRPPGMAAANCRRQEPGKLRVAHRPSVRRVRRLLSRYRREDHEDHPGHRARLHRCPRPVRPRRLRAASHRHTREICHTVTRRTVGRCGASRAFRCAWAWPFSCWAATAATAR